MRMEMTPSPEPGLSVRVWQRFADVLWHRDYEASKLAGAFIWLLWSLALLNPFSDAFSSAPGYRAMAFCAPEQVWGAIGLLLSANEFCSMMSAVRWWRVTASGLLFAWALLVGSMIGLVNMSGTGVATYLGIGMVSCFAFWRSFVPPREVA